MGWRVCLKFPVSVDDGEVLHFAFERLRRLDLAHVPTLATALPQLPNRSTFPHIIVFHTHHRRVAVVGLRSERITVIPQLSNRPKGFLMSRKYGLPIETLKVRSHQDLG